MLPGHAGRIFHGLLSALGTSSLPLLAMMVDFVVKHDLSDTHNVFCADFYGMIICLITFMCTQLYRRILESERARPLIMALSSAQNA